MSATIVQTPTRQERPDLFVRLPANATLVATAAADSGKGLVVNATGKYAIGGAGVFADFILAEVINAAYVWGRIPGGPPCKLRSGAATAELAFLTMDADGEWVAAATGEEATFRGQNATANADETIVATALSHIAE